MAKNRFDLDYCEKKLGRNMPAKATDVRYVACSRSGHSETACLTFLPRNDKVFVKEYFFPQVDRLDTSALYAAERNPKLLYFQEKRNTQRIYNHVGPGLVPRVLAGDDEHLVLFFEYLKEPSDAELFLEARKNNDEKAKLDLIYQGAKKIARLNGRLNFNNKLFASDLTEQRHTIEAKTARLTDYLLKILEHKHPILPGVEASRSTDLFRDFIRQQYNLDLAEEVRTLVMKEEALNEKYVLQHGDCRVHHILGDKFVDLEQFGLHGQGYDLVTYLSAEGGIAAPSISELPNLVGWFLAYERANSHKDGSRRKTSLQKLDSMTRSGVVQRISSSDLAGSTVRFLRKDLVESLHLDSSNKRYDAAHLQQLIPGIPHYSLEEMYRARLHHIRDVFELVSENDLMWGVLDNKVGIKDYFHSFAELLVKLELVDISPETLAKIKK
ncbi:MAG: hypothetical protein Q7K45_06730 [Nanoarchaeota archaeon]|nr:hypothetical protein [Nanoarchaeota archaeon]